jgi:hypothetical protein
VWPSEEPYDGGISAEDSYSLLKAKGFSDTLS